MFMIVTESRFHCAKSPPITNTEVNSKNNFSPCKEIYPDKSRFSAAAVRNKEPKLTFTLRGNGARAESLRESWSVKHTHNMFSLQTGSSQRQTIASLAGGDGRPQRVTERPQGLCLEDSATE